MKGEKGMLSDRQKMILRAIVDDYVRSAEPVGSRTISKRNDVSYSPATIRNEMADLEEMGFLEQPHTSAGRIPSNKGYRFYVDNLLELEHPDSNMEQLRRYFEVQTSELEQVIQQTAIILSQLTNYTAIVLGQENAGATLRHMQILPLSEDKAVAIIVTNTGHVENRTITVPEGISVYDMEKLCNLLNHRLTGVPLSQLKYKLTNEMTEQISRHVHSMDQAMSLLEQVVRTDSEERVYLGGTSKMLGQPEFKDVDKIKGVMELLEQNELLLKLIGSSANGLHVRIGQENLLEAVSHCSIVTATYSIDGNAIGTIGILGPTRMDYRRVIGVLNILSKDLPDILSRWYK